jgi:hypothetical protein
MVSEVELIVGEREPIASLHVHLMITVGLSCLVNVVASHFLYSVQALNCADLA